MLDQPIRTGNLKDMDTPFTQITTAADITPALTELVELVYEGWWENEPRIDWHSFLDRLELMGHFDFGSSMDSEAIKAIKKQVRKLRAA